MFPFANYPYEYYSCNVPFGCQIPFNYMAPNQPFYVFYDCNSNEGNSIFHSSSEGQIVPKRHDLKRNVHVLKKEQSENHSL